MKAKAQTPLRREVEGPRVPFRVWLVWGFPPLILGEVGWEEGGLSPRPSRLPQGLCISPGLRAPRPRFQGPAAAQTRGDAAERAGRAPRGRAAVPAARPGRGAGGAGRTRQRPESPTRKVSLELPAVPRKRCNPDSFLGETSSEIFSRLEKKKKGVFNVCVGGGGKGPGQDVEVRGSGGGREGKAGQRLPEPPRGSGNPLGAAGLGGEGGGVRGKDFDSPC